MEQPRPPSRQAPSGTEPARAAKAAGKVAAAGAKAASRRFLAVMIALLGTTAALGGLVLAPQLLGGDAQAQAQDEPLVVTDASLAQGAVTLTKFAAGLQPIQALDALPPPGEPGRVVFLTTDHKLYRDTGQGWTSKVAATDLEGLLQTGQIEPGAIRRELLANGSVDGSKLADGAVTGAKLAAGSIDASKVAGHLRFIEHYASLPAAGTRDRIVLQGSDHQLYIDDGAAWAPVRAVAPATPQVTLPIQSSGIAEGAVALSKFAAGLRPVEVLSVLPGAGTPGRLAYMAGGLYLDNGTAWSAVGAASSGNTTVIVHGNLTVDDGAVTTVKLADGAVTLAKFSPGLRPIETYAALPPAGEQGRVAFLTADNRLYLDDGIAWQPLASPSASSAPTYALADGAVTSVKLADGAVLLAKLGNATFTSDAAGRAKFEPGFVDATLLLDGAVATASLQDGAVTGVKLADGSVILAKLPDGLFAADAAGRAKFGAGFVDAGLLADGSVDVEAFRSGLRPVEVLDALPDAGTEGRIAYLTTDDRLYRDNGTAWLGEAQHGLQDGSVTGATILDGTITAADLADGSVTAEKLDSSIGVVQVVDALPPSGAQGRLAFLKADGKLYRDTGSGWTSHVAAQDIEGLIEGAQLADAAIETRHLLDGAVTAAKLAPTVGFVQTVDELPLASPVGRLVYLTTDGKLHRFTGESWTSAVAAEDLDGAIQSSQLADASVTAAKLADGAIAISKLADGAFTADEAGRAKFAPGLVDAAMLSDGIVTALKLADGSVLLAKLPDAVFTADAAGRAKFAAGFVEADLLADGSVGTGKLADLAVTTAKLADGSVTLVKIADATFSADPAGRSKFAAGFVDAGLVAAGAITADKLDPAIGYLQTVAELPPAGTQGRVVFLTTDNKLHRDTGIAWVAAADLSDIPAASGWSASNDGPGSGLDADRLDGLDSSSFLRKDMYQTFTGSSLTVNGQLTMNADVLIQDNHKMLVTGEAWSGPQSPWFPAYPTTWTDAGKTYTVEKNTFWQNNRHMYMRVTTPDGMTWDQARIQARWLGAYLATITSAEEMTFVKDNVLGGTADRCRIGLTDGANEGNFQWVTGESDVHGENGRYSNWNPSEPNNSGGSQDTGVIYNTGTNFPKWDDEIASAATPCAVFEVSFMMSGG